MAIKNNKISGLFYLSVLFLCLYVILPLIIQLCNAYQAENGNIIISSYSGDNRIPKRGDNIDINQYVATGEFSRSNRANNVNNNQINDNPVRIDDTRDSSGRK